MVHRSSKIPHFTPAPQAEGAAVWANARGTQRTFASLLACIFLVISFARAVPGLCCETETPKAEVEATQCCAASRQSSPSEPEPAPCECPLECAQWRIAQLTTTISVNQVQVVTSLKSLPTAQPVAPAALALEPTPANWNSHHDPPRLRGRYRTHIQLNVLRC